MNKAPEGADYFDCHTWELIDDSTVKAEGSWITADRRLVPINQEIPNETTTCLFTVNEAQLDELRSQNIVNADCYKETVQ